MSKLLKVAIYRQQGVMLLVALVMLFIMTVAGISTMTGATLQERIAGNQRQQLIARGNAELVIRQAETVLNGLAPAGKFNGNTLNAKFATLNDGFYTPIEGIIGGGFIQQPAFDRRQDTGWNNTNSEEVTSAGGAVLGRYIIEYMGRSSFSKNSNPDEILSPDDSEPSGRRVFRITALGLASSGRIASIIETHFFEAL